MGVEDDAAGIGGGVEEDELCFVGDEWRDSLGGEFEVGVGVAGDGFGAAHGGEVRVGDEVWVGDDALVTWVQERHEREVEGAGGSGGDECGGLTGFPLVGCRTVPVEIVFEPIDDFAQECGIALALGVSVLVGVDGVDCRRADRLGDWEVGLSDREVDRVFECRGESEDSADTRRIDSV